MQTKAREETQKRGGSPGLRQAMTTVQQIIRSRRTVAELKDEAGVTRSQVADTHKVLPPGAGLSSVWIDDERRASPDSTTTLGPSGGYRGAPVGYFSSGGLGSYPHSYDRNAPSSPAYLFRPGTNSRYNSIVLRFTSSLRSSVRRSPCLLQHRTRYRLQPRVRHRLQPHVRCHLQWRVW
ncbi:hypothetical protein BCR34DRAFT_210651 [Clohesyomyces aquaticus]|uniref:Uncharacterized protein n=1 Tax=Clohesyomyces aquaticus TaxID=1231657 RepID=A0A1Y2A9T4_9PLEO|nr:hypothetical protein BCR34DRAFT_210651 [Clohesyomyces aquaticus]